MQFSIVIPLFNKEKFITNTICSVLNQSHQNFEILVINDGSTDNSISVLNSIDDNRLKVIHQENKGVSSARNRGIAESKYDLIGFLDADDLWEPDFLSEIGKLVRSFPDCGLYATSYKSKRDKIITDHRSKLLPDDHSYVIQDYFDFINNNFAFNASSVVAKKSEFETVGLFPEGIIKREDYDMWIRFFIFSKIGFINKTLTTYIYDESEKPYHRIDETSQYYDISQLKNYINEGKVSKEHLNSAKKYILRHEIPLLRAVIRTKNVKSIILKFYEIWMLGFSKLKLTKIGIIELWGSIIYEKK